MGGVYFGNYFVVMINYLYGSSYNYIISSFKLLRQRIYLILGGETQAWGVRVKLGGRDSSLGGESQAWGARVKLGGRESSLGGETQACEVRLKLGGRDSSLG